MNKIITSIFLITLLAGCDNLSTSEQKEAHQQELINLASQRAVGIPAIINF